jgi:type IV pilus assembly protein PilE
MKRRKIGLAKSPSRQAAFTLVEQLVVIAMIAILGSLTMPSYHMYLIRGCIADATTNLSTKRAQLEQFFQDSRSYVGASGCDLDTTTSKYFDFSCSVQTETTYVLQAIGKDLAAGFIYSIDQITANLRRLSLPDG